MEERTRRQADWIVIIGAIACLIVWGLSSSQRLPRLREQLATGTPQEQVAATETLVKARLLGDAVLEQPRWVQDRAVSAVAAINTPQAWHQLLNAWSLLDSPSQVRATEVLKSTGNSAIPTLVEALKDKDAKTRAGVNAVLISVGEPAIPYIMPLMDAWDDYVRTGVYLVLGGIGEPAVAGLVKVIQKTGPSGEQDADEYLRERATAQSALKLMKAGAFDAIVNQLLTTDNPDTRGVAVSLLGAIADQTIAAPLAAEDAQAVIAPLLDTLQSDPSYAVRRKAAAALGLLAAVGVENGASQPLVSRLRDAGEHPDVRAAVAEALGKLADPTTAAPLAQVLVSPASREGITSALQGALIRIGTPAVPSLAQYATAADPSTQLLVTQTLARNSWRPTDRAAGKHSRFRIGARQTHCR